MRVVIATVQVPFVRGGAEILTEDLANCIASRGAQVEIVNIPWKWFPGSSILDSMLAFRLLDFSHCVAGPIDVLIGMKFPAYLVRHSNKVLWIAHQHRLAYDLWDDLYGLAYDARGAQVRDAIRRADQQAFQEAKRIFTISKNVSKRLDDFLGVASVPLYPPPRRAEALYCAPSQDYLFLPSRIAPLKRHDLILEALSLTKEPVRLRCAGTGDPESHVSEMRSLSQDLGVDSRVDWLGWISEDELIDGYANALGVIYTPVDEDYGYVTLEAMLASKAVITCSDSGGCLEFLLDKESGLIADPEPTALADAMDELWRERERTRSWGEAGRRHYDSLEIGWDRTLEALLR